MAHLTKFRRQRPEHGRFFRQSDADVIRAPSHGRDVFKHAGLSGAVDPAAKAVRPQMTRQAGRFGKRADHPIASDFAGEVALEDFANAPVRGSRREPRQGDAITRPEVASEQPNHVLVVMELDPGQPAPEPQHRGVIQLDLGGKQGIGGPGECARKSIRGIPLMTES